MLFYLKPIKLNIVFKSQLNKRFHLNQMPSLALIFVVRVNMFNLIQSKTLF